MSERYWWTCGSGRIELQMTRKQAESVSHSGDCGADVDVLAANPGIAAQLAKLDSETLRRELREYGAWDANELRDHSANLRRILWIAGGDLRDAGFVSL